MATPSLERRLTDRLTSLDAYRGFIMLLMASSGLAFAQVVHHMEWTALAASTVGLAGQDPLQAAAALTPGRPTQPPTVSPVWQFLAYQFEHVSWIGCAFWDLIQPSFMFMVGVALPYSFAGRKAKGESYRRMLLHAIWRAFLLILLAVFLSSPAAIPSGTGDPRGPVTNWIFPNVLAQIGLGYVFVFLLVGRGIWLQGLALVVILAGVTLFFELYPAPSQGFDFRSVGGPGDLQPLTGRFAHWEKNTNAAAAFDRWFLNLFPRVTPFKFNEGGYQTLNFIPSMATMILGLMGGEFLRRPKRPAAKCAGLALAGAACLAIGWLMGQYVSPLVKRIWTPSWAVFSSGWTFLMLAGFYGIIDVIGLKRWAFPFVVVGMNSIAMYCMSQLLRPWIRNSLRTHFGRWWFDGPYGPIYLSAAILLVLWLFCYWLYRRRIFLRI
jgi:predicted acyltransferase